MYFFDTGMVRGKGARFENACATMLLKHTHYLHDVQGRRVTLHDARDRSGRETDFVLREDGAPVVLAECKLNDASVARLLLALAELLPAAAVIQLVRELCKPEQRGRVAIEPVARWLAELAA